MIAVVALVFAGDALACSCAPVDLVRDLSRADGAFIGTLLERRETEASVLMLFRVEQVYKGDIENRVEVKTSRDGGGTCGLELEVGQRTGLLLDGGPEFWRSSLCSQVEPAAFLELTDVKDDLPAINWGGIVVGLLILLAGAYFFLRRLRR